MKRRKYHRRYVVKTRGVEDIFYISTEQYSRGKPHTMTKKEAILLKTELRKIYYGKFKIERICLT